MRTTFWAYLGGVWLLLLCGGVKGMTAEQAFHQGDTTPPRVGVLQPPPDTTAVVMPRRHFAYRFVAYYELVTFPQSSQTY